MRKYAVYLILCLLLSSLMLTACTGEKTESEGLSGNLKLAGSTSVQPLAEELALKFMEENPDVKIDVVGGGSGAGVESAENGASNIGMISRDLKDEEIDLYPELRKIVIANDGIAVIVNKDNPLEDISLEEIKKVFQGQLVTWDLLSGGEGNITGINREEGSGTRGAFQEIVLDKEDFYEKLIVQNSTGAVKEAIKTDLNAIGYISMGALSPDIKALKVDGAEASLENVKNNKYKISRPFNFVVKGEQTELEKEFISWVLGEAGQEIVEEQGYIAVK